jgi:hypothetical protein
MKAISLADKEPSIVELLALAESEPVYIRTADGRDFLLEPADEFEREAAALGRSENFMSFLRNRSAERDESSAEEVARRLGLRDDPNAKEPISTQL